MTERNTTIDFLRGFAIIIMILIHVTAYYLNEPITHIIWDYTHFAVPLFVFCSAYVYFERKKDEQFSWSYFYKRAKRLVIPYYIYHIIFFLLVFLLIQTLPPAQRILSYFLLKGSSDRYLSWLVVLFLYLIILMPFIKFIAMKKYWFVLFTFLSVASNIYLLFSVPNISFRYYMWLPWSLILIITWLFLKTKRKTLFIIITIAVSSLIFMSTQQLLLEKGSSLVLVNNKYPPNLYYLSYGCIWIFSLYYLHQIFHIKEGTFQRFFNFISRNSYSFFFIHFLYLIILIDILKIRIKHWGIYFLLIFGLSVVTQIILNVFTRYFRSTLKKAN